MRSFRRVTQRVAPAVVAVASIVVFATCDLDKITSPKSSANQSEITLAIQGDTALILGDSLHLDVDAGSADLSHTVQRWSSSNPSVVAVDSVTGLMRGVGVGLATITARLLAPELDTGVVASHTLRVHFKNIRVAPIDSIPGLGMSRSVVVRGTNIHDNLAGPAISSASLTAHDSGGTASTIVAVNALNVVAKAPGKAYVIALFDNLKDSVLVKVRQVTKSLAFLTSPYVANAVCNGTCPNGGRHIPVVARDVADSIIVNPSLHWQSSDSTQLEIDGATGLLRVRSFNPTAIITVTSDTVSRTTSVSVSQVVATLTKLAASDSQSTTVGTQVGVAPQVTATDSGGTLVANASITFQVAAGHGVVTGPVKVTDINGRATVDAWQLGDTAGFNSLTATAPDSVSTTFVATGTPGAAAKLAFQVNPMSAAPGAFISPALQVAIEDAFGNVDTSATNVVTLVFGNNTGGATLGGVVSKAAANGLVTFDSVSIDNAGVGYTLVAQASGLTDGTSRPFNIATANTWTGLQDMPQGRSSPAADTINGLLYVASGANATAEDPSLQIYHPATNTWTFGASMPVGRYWMSGGSSINGKLYVAGGVTASANLPTNTLFIYSAATDSWTTGATMPSLSGCGGSGVIGGKMYVFSGCDGNSGYRNLLYSYDPATNTWATLASAPNSHGFPAVAVVNGKLYVAGGFDGTASAVTAAVDVYDPATNSWTTSAPLPVSRAGASAASLNGKLYVFGGSDGSNDMARVDIYDPASNTWTTGTDMTSVRETMGIGVLAGNIIVAGGYGIAGPLNTVQAYAP